MPAYDYSRVADLYDDFCVFDGDIEFFRRMTAPVDGPVLELMAGTGRVSVPMLEHGIALTCVDRCPAMLAVLANKIRNRDFRAGLVCADVCHLPFAGKFQMAILPFQGFTELTDGTEQRRVMSEVAGLLHRGGRFVCTSHNPATRGATVDGRWRELGRFAGPDGKTLVLHLRVAHGDRPGLVVGTQKIEVLDREGKVAESRRIDLRFCLTPADVIVDLAHSAGLRTVDLYGDYLGAPYDEDSSASLVAVFEMPA